jgi:4-hydroxy-2-oxoheptanedioate aldolase
MRIDMLEKNKLRATIQKKGYAIGTCAYSFSPDIVQIAGYSGMDFCRIDNEHSWRKDDSLENMIRAANLSNMSTVIRVDRDSPYEVRKALELGSHAIVIPQIESKKEVEDYISWTKFPPLGKRGFSNLNQSAHYGLINSKEWIDWCNSEIMVGVMVETKTAVDEIDEILSTKGLDYILIGASDLSLSLGLEKPEMNHPLVQQSIIKIIERAKHHKVYTMLGVGYPWIDQAKNYLNLGIDMIEVGHDYSILSTVWRDVGEQLR